MKYYGAPTTPKAVDLNSVVKSIEKSTSLSSSDIKACLDALQYEFIEHLKHGRSVRLGDVGSFRISLKTRGANTEDGFSTSNIRGVKVVFSPSSKLYKSLQPGADGVSFQVVRPEEEEEEVTEE